MLKARLVGLVALTVRIDTSLETPVDSWRMPALVRIACFVIVLGIAGVNTAQAQEAGQVGMTFGYPASIGLVWQLSDHLAIRPDVSVSGGSQQSGQKSTTIGTDISGLVFIHTWDNVRAYVGPTLSYSRNTDSNLSLSGASSTNSSYSGAGFFGTQYALSHRFSVFGEVGFSYTHFALDSTLPGISPSTRNAYGTVTGVGAILYFK